MITIKCIICGDKIKHPKINQLCCNKPKCINDYTKLQHEVWRSKNLNKIKERNKNSYLKRKNENV